MRRKFFTALIFGVLTTRLGACSGGQSTTGGEDGIKLGLNLELSGGVSSYGQSLREGMLLAIEEINDNGGILDKKIEYVEIDNKSDAAEAASAATRLTSEEQVFAIMGAATSGNTKAQIEIANDTKTLLITPSGTSPDLTVNEDGSVNEYVFRVSYIDPFQGEIAAQFAVEELGVKNAAVYYDNASDYSQGLAKSFTDKFEELGGTVVIQESFVAGDTDFRSTLTRIKGENPEFIYIPAYYEEVGLIIAQARELGIDVPLMGADGWDSPKLIELAGPDAVNNTFITNHYSSQDPDEKIQEFVEKFKNKYDGKSPDAFNALGYDAIYMLKDAIERAGKLDTTAVKEALEATEGLELISGTITIDENHNPIKSATILEYKDGEQVFRSKIDP